jgi:SAM-dependent methyltransferase
LDILLSRMGFEVTAVDRGGPVIQNARAEDDTQKVKFVEHELQTLDFPENSFDAVIVIETLGLMSRDHDLSLLKNAFKWLRNGGSIVVDGPLKPSVQNSWEKEFPSGKVFARTSFDENTRLHQLNFEFWPVKGEPFLLRDTQGSARDTGAGLTRYIYPPEELLDLLAEVGFQARSETHFNEGYYGLIGIKG